LSIGPRGILGELLGQLGHNDLSLDAKLGEAALDAKWKLIGVALRRHGVLRTRAIGPISSAHLSYVPAKSNGSEHKVGI
jgi:hypothetical protein